MSDSCKLNFIKGLFIVNEHDRCTSLYELSCLSFRHVGLPILCKYNTAIVHSQSSNEVVLLELHPEDVRAAEENLFFGLVDSSHDGLNLNWITLHSLLILVLTDEVMVLLGVHELCTIILYGILLILNIKHFLNILQVAHFT